jgi:hypothetical protein
MSNAFWMNSGDPVETAEMLSVERKNVSHPMNDHGGDKAAIMKLLPSHFIPAYDAPRLIIRGGAIG